MQSKKSKPDFKQAYKAWEKAEKDYQKKKELKMLEEEYKKEKYKALNSIKQISLKEAQEKFGQGNHSYTQTTTGSNSYAPTWTTHFLSSRSKLVKAAHMVSVSPYATQGEYLTAKEWCRDMALKKLMQEMKNSGLLLYRYREIPDTDAMECTITARINHIDYPGDNMQVGLNKLDDEEIGILAEDLVGMSKEEIANTLKTFIRWQEKEPKTKEGGTSLRGKLYSWPKAMVWNQTEHGVVMDDPEGSQKT